MLSITDGLGAETQLTQILRAFKQRQEAAAITDQPQVFLAPVPPATAPTPPAPTSLPPGVQTLLPVPAAGAPVPAAGSPVLASAGFPAALPVAFLPEEPTPWFKNPLILGAIGAGVLVVGAGSYMLLRG